jgi:hypothetical protein
MLVMASISFSNDSIWEFSDSTALPNHSRASSLAFSLGSFAFRAAMRPSLLNAFVLVSFSTSRKRSISISIFLRASRRGALSLTSFDPAHVLTWSRKRWSFLISFLRSPCEERARTGGGGGEEDGVSEERGGWG